MVWIIWPSSHDSVKAVSIYKARRFSGKENHAITDLKPKKNQVMFMGSCRHKEGVADSLACGSAGFVSMLDFLQGSHWIFKLIFFNILRLALCTFDKFKVQ